MCKNRRKIGCVLGLAWWAVGLVSAQRKKRKKKESVWLVNCIRGPLGVGGPHGVFQISCRGSKILVIILGNFRRLGIVIIINVLYIYSSQ